MVCDEIIDFGMRAHYLTVVLFWSSTISITVGSQASHGLLTVARGGVLMVALPYYLVAIAGSYGTPCYS